MHNNHRRNKIIPLSVSLLLLMTLFISGRLLFAGENLQKETVAEENKTSPDDKKQTKKVDKQPAVFVPVEKVSADQAVAFPTDI